MYVFSDCWVKSISWARGSASNNDFCYQVVAQVGSYADIYERHLGPGTPYDLPRGLNALYTNGGILYPLPFQ